MGFVLYGRGPERRRIEQLIASTRVGDSALLVVRGEVGIGKSALLRYAADHAGGMTVLRGSGVQTDAELPLAALHQLVRPLLDRIDELPAPQAAALRGAFGLTSVRQVDRMLVALGTLTLLAEAADERPVLCVVDDGQWLDQPTADTLWFVANRLMAERIGILVAVRDGSPHLFPDADELLVGGLDPDAATALLADTHPELSAEVAGRVIAETSANPLGLRELPNALTPAQRAGTDPILGPLPLPDRIQRRYEEQLEALPSDTRALLLLAAAEDTGDLAVVLRAAETYDLTADAVAAAESAGLVSVEETIGGARLRFRHPLLRAAAYRTATFNEQIAAHTALARSIDPEADQHAWHLAAAATGPDDDVAAALERTGRGALRRGAPASASAAFEKAAQLTGCTTDQARRLVTAAQAANSAGHPDQAERLVSKAEPLTSDRIVQATIRQLRALMAFDRGSPAASHQLLMDDAAAVAADDPELAAMLLVDAIKNAWFVNAGDRVRDATDALRKLSLPEDSPCTPIVLAVLRFGDRLKALLGQRPDPAVEGRSTSPTYDVETDQPLGLILQAVAAISLADDATALADASKAAQACRSSGQLDLLVLALQAQATGEMVTGRHRFARATATEGLELATTIGHDNGACHFRAVLATLDAIAGEAESCRKLAHAALEHAELQRVTPVVGLGRWALGLLELGTGEPDRAIDQLVSRGKSSGDHPLIALLRTPDLVEAAARVGRADEMTSHVEQLATWVRDGDRPWAHALELRCRAVLAGDEDCAGELFTEALESHDEADRSGQARPFDRARTQLLFGEWLRRQRRPTEARIPLQAALDVFERLGAKPWAERAGSELRASGRAFRAAVPTAASGLTPQEIQVVRLAREGASNREIGAQLFLSPRTVGYHLHKTFRKLGIRSRVELVHVQLDPEVPESQS